MGIDWVGTFSHLDELLGGFDYLFVELLSHYVKLYQIIDVFNTHTWLFQVCSIIFGKYSVMADLNLGR